MSRNITDSFKQCRARGRKALMPFLTAGFPDKRTFLDLMRDLYQSGADMIEVGIPFSDPLADGKTIQASSHAALKNGVNISRTLEYIDKLNGIERPVILMSYFNPVYRYGTERFLRHCSELDVGGLIIPDLIPEEGGSIESLCRERDIDLIYLLARTSGEKRKDEILRRSRGFVYLVSIAGVTGARNALPRNLIPWVKGIKNRSRLPVCVGFGISAAAQAKAISAAADGVIIGSALIDRIIGAPNRHRAVQRAGKFIREIRKGMDDE